MTASHGPVVAAAEGKVLTLRINRPRAENRLNLEVLRRLTASLEAADADPDVAAVVLTGTGETFSCGGDVAEFAAGDAGSYREFGQRFAALHLAVLRLSKPVLAAVNGDARAGGLSLLAACDLAVGVETARFAMPEIRSGLWPILAMVALNRALPQKRAFELYYFGESFGAGEARELGLLNWTAPRDRYEEEVRSRARKLTSLPRSAVRIGRPTFAAYADRSCEEAYRHGVERLVELLTDPEAARALAGAKSERGEP